MDRGAARSRKRLQKGENPSPIESSAATSSSAPSATRHDRTDRHRGQSDNTNRPFKSLPSKGSGKSQADSSSSSFTPRLPRSDRPGRPDRPNRPPRSDGDRPDRPARPAPRSRPEPSNDPNQYKSKAIRTSAALVYSQSPFDIPPPREKMVGVTRLDLEGSGATDLTWLEGTGVTWLSVKGCPVVEGWESVGTLSELAVLNISACGLTTLPKPLVNLSKLKAIVAMNNEWESLDHDVVAGWKELNSMIVSHSLNLASLPSSMATLIHLAKITISHCPRLSAASLPDLSPLPLLRDVRANNLPHLTALPAHIATWGTGDLALTGKAVVPSSKPSTEVTRLGDGLEVLDLGNCSLSFAAVSKLFALDKSTTKLTKTKPRWRHLRSITLHSNPLALEQPSYADLLQASPDLPGLQIIDSRRVVERKRKGEAPVSKAERREKERKEKKAKPTGANAGDSTKMRKWGSGVAEDGDGEHVEGKEEVATEEKAGEIERPRKKSKRDPELRDAIKSTSKASSKTHSDDSHDRPSKKRKHNDVASTLSKSKSATTSVPAAPTVPVVVSTPADPTAVTKTKSKPSKTQTAVVGVIEVGASTGGKGQASSGKSKSKSGGIDLKQVFGAKDAGLGLGGSGLGGDTGSGLGMGGW